jgi:hypothetical protein
MTITRVGTIGLYDKDKARSLGFYVNKLGLAKCLDELISPRLTL